MHGKIMKKKHIITAIMIDNEHPQYLEIREMMPSCMKILFFNDFRNDTHI